MTAWHRWARLLLLWAAALSLPVQGWAAATAAHCLLASVPTGAPAWGPDRAAADTGVPVPGDEASAPCPHGHTMHGVAADVDGLGSDALPASGPGGSDGPTSDHRCSACAACLLGTAVLLDTAARPASIGEVTAGLAVFQSTVPVGFITGGPERPPRSPLP